VRATRSFGAALALASALAASPARASEPGSIEGLGRITVGGGVRWLPNDHFKKGAEGEGFPLESSWAVGPMGFATFGYGVLSFLEVSIDLIAAGERFKLLDRPEYSSVTYGPLLGARVMKADLFFEGFTPMAGVLLGPIFSHVSRDDGLVEERVTTGLSIVAGFAFRLSHRFGIWTEARYLLARGVVPEMTTGINTGGFWFGAGFTVYLETPGSEELGSEPLRMPTSF
jgi:hypothetical protein